MTAWRCLAPEICVTLGVNRTRLKLDMFGRDPRGPADGEDRASGDAALQILEVLLITLVEKGVIDADHLAAELEDLALDSSTSTSARLQDIKRHLAEIAISIAASDRKLS